MKIFNTKFKGLKIVKQDSYRDKRGLLKVTHNEKIIKKKNFIIFDMRNIYSTSKMKEKKIKYFAIGC